MNNTNKRELESARKIREEVTKFPDTLVMLGSGWNKILDFVEVSNRVSYKRIFGVETSVPGHEGELVVGEIEGKAIAFMSGRFHLYEGYSAHEATFPIRVFSELGVKRLIVTSASGGINPDYMVGDIVILSDLITMFIPTNPLVGPKFQDMSQVFDPEMRDAAISASKANSISYKEGVYMYLPGPHYETPSDKRAVSILGADCVGMSTVPEVLQAKNLGMKVLGLSFVTNLAFVKHSHEEVVKAANEGSKNMSTLLRRVI